MDSKKLKNVKYAVGLGGFFLFIFKPVTVYGVPRCKIWIMLFKQCKGAGKLGCSSTPGMLWTQGPGISKIDTRLWFKKLTAQGFRMFLVQCQRNQLMPFCRCPTQHFMQALSFALSALLFRWALGGIHTPVFTKKVLVALAKVTLKLLIVFDFKSFTDLFSFFLPWHKVILGFAAQGCSKQGEKRKYLSERIGFQGFWGVLLCR